MNIAQISRFGPFKDVIEVIDKENFQDPKGKDITIRMLAMPINPSDILTIEGNYGIQPALPYTPGNEGVGRVEAVGPDVSRLKTGDLVMSMAGSAWQELVQCPETAAILLPASIDIEQASMIMANPATAEVMLTTILPLNRGDWIMQNASNSAVGRYIVRLAKIKGINLVNIVRRQDAVEALKKDGTEHVLLVDEQSKDDDIVETVRKITGRDGPRLGFDAIGGTATNLLAACLADGGKVVNYGLLSGLPCSIDPFHLVFRRISLAGFWLADWFRSATRLDINELYGKLIPLVNDGTLTGHVEARYPLNDVGLALEHASQGHRNGKILLIAPARNQED